MSLQFTKVVVDENVPKEVVDCLKGLGFKEVWWVPEHRAGMTDPEVWRKASEKEAILLTGDLGFVAQLQRQEAAEGPVVIEYLTEGFQRDELRNPSLMRFLVEWIFQNGHHREKEITRLHVRGTVRSRLQVWNEEKQRTGRRS